MHSSYVAYVLLGLIAARVGLFILKSLTSPLRSVPGPFLARFTKLWYFEKLRAGRFEKDDIELHSKYGPIFRIAPNWYSIDAPEVVKTVYGIASKFPKSDWYEGWKHPSPDRWTLFPDQNMERHARERKKFQAMYSLSSLVNYEGYVDSCAALFDQRLKEFAASGQVINMGHWFQCYAFDVIGDITYSRRFGFLDTGDDVGGLLEALGNVMQYSSLIGIYAWLHPIIFDFMCRFKASGAGGRAYINNVVQEWMEKRKRETQDPKEMIEKEEGAPQDFLEKLMIANAKEPEKITQYNIYMVGLSNIIAGSDTTAITLSAILYYLLKSPSTLERLRDEIRKCDADGGEGGEGGEGGAAGNPIITFKQSQDMPYLQAVIKEAMRLHAAVGLPLWRVVPEGGTEIAGKYFPAGSVVGLNPWVAHYNESVFGPDAKEFKPERWLDAEEEGGEQIKAMNGYYLPFGLGSRTCLGRHISALEMSKLIPRVVRDFDFELETPDKEWTNKNHWFVKPVDFRVRVKSRKS